MKTIAELLNDHSLPQIGIADITADSREVRSGSAFFAVKGTSVDGHDFVDQAIEKGAAAVVVDRQGKTNQDLNHGNVFEVENSKKAFALASHEFYDRPSEELMVVGVTGTSGKTTTTFIIESILKSAGLKSGLIGTICFRSGDTILESTHTTPGAKELQALLRRMRDDGCQAVVMEVSSHALKQYRAHGTRFRAAVFNNLTPEHLDYHPDMEDYYQSKKILFSELLSKVDGKEPVAVVNTNDEFGKRLAVDLESEGISSVPFYSAGDSLQVTSDGVTGTLDSVKVRSNLIGKFNLENIAGAVTVYRKLGVEDKPVELGVSNLKSVPGRLEPVPNDRGVRVLVDYAHKPDALKKVLQTIGDSIGSNRVITVFGCGGDRDRSKRSAMAQIAEELSDIVYVTSDNPRTEDPKKIIDEICEGFSKGIEKKLHIETDRRKAIVDAIRESREGDTILIAGKGHEDYQILGTQKVHFDDREIAAKALQQDASH